MQLRNVKTRNGKWRWHVVDLDDKNPSFFAGMPPLCGHGVLDHRSHDELRRFDPEAEGMCETCVATWRMGGLQN